VQDFGPYITAIMASGAEVVITGNYGQDLRLLLQQGAALGWKVTVGSFFLDPPILSVTGKAAIGHVNAGDYLLTIDTPENRDFIRQWRERYPDAPLSSRFPELVLWLVDVIRRAGSSEAEKLIKAWEGSRFKTPWGEVEMRACDHQMLTPGWVAEVLEPERIPQNLRYFGQEFPYMGRATRISRDDMTVPPAESGNKRCAGA
jgi:branched-chain amino acid transport system substrate-binding protein